jgi:hypothetical protein
VARFQPGQSGNPAGRPAGSRNRATLAAEAMIDKSGKKLITKAIELALAGDSTAMRLCLERLVPPRKGSPVRFSLPKLSNAGDVRDAALALVQAVSVGELTPEEAAAVSPLIDSARKAIEVDEIERRLAELERQAEVRR